MPTPHVHPDDAVTIFATTDFRGQHARFGIKRKDRRSHMYLVGRTGTGKSTLLETLMAADLRAGNGFALLDPHGDLAERIRNRVETSRPADLIVFDPARQPMGYNPLWCPDPGSRYLVASGLVSVFRKLWHESWGPRLEHILRQALLTLVEFPGSTLVDLPRLLTDQAFRRAVVARVSDPEVRAFWKAEFDRYSVNFRNEAVAPILNKVGAFLASPAVRAVVGDREARLDLGAVMDQGRIVVADLAKGRLGEDASSLLGALLVTGFEQAALRRVGLPESARRDFYLYLDEVQSFATLSFASMLQEVRKFRLSLIMANQYLEQLEEPVRLAILGTVGTLVCFRIGVRDAKILADEFFPELTPVDLVSLPCYHVYLRLMVNGVVSRGFSAVTLTPSAPAEGTLLPGLDNAA